MEMIVLLLLLCAGVRSQDTLVIGGHIRQYIRSNKTLTWSEAQTYCRTNFTDLLTMYNEKDNYIAPTSKPSSELWTGLHRRNPSLWWSNGDPVDFTPWSNAPNTDVPYCATVTTNNNITWENCTLRLPFMCYHKDIGTSYRYILIPERMSWCGARSYCQQRHTDLAVIRNQSQYDEVMQIKSISPFWIGLKSNGWEWSDGECFDYSFITDTNLNNCSYFMHYKKNLGISGMDCEGPLEALCYKDLMTVEIIYQKMDWEEALQYCFDNHDGMLTITSLHDQMVVKQKLSSAGFAGHVWVGLRQSRIFGFWLWTSDVPVKWHNWEGGMAPEMPLSYNCGAVSMEDFKWSDQHCLVKRYFVCERRKL
ncbi:macrophage mannose receptor 1-like isoform X1 [Osmerus eperlanus]|uniref:macrophage mannose receptor 1-like isoform X1 n=1 Tax=Osmerus eperlanus TaxID=29151 RepID=UPI002E11F0FC